MGLTDYKMRLTRDSMIVRADSFAPLSLTSSESIAIKGDLTIHGAAACDSLRGASIGTPVALASTKIVINVLYTRYLFISPIVGRIRNIYYIANGAVISPGMEMQFFNMDGVKATTGLDSVAVSENEVETITFDWTDENDLLFCSVGVGSTFWAMISKIHVAGYGFVCADIVPLISGGPYE